MSRIRSISGWLALDSRGWPTPAVRVEVDGGSAVALAPAGASTGAHEDPELRDGGGDWEGRGINRALSLINGRMASALVGLDASDPGHLDAALEAHRPDGGWGGNSTVAVTLAAMLAVADARALEPWQWIAEVSETLRPTIPMPMVNIVSGGAHAGRAMDIQDVLVIPIAARSFHEAIEMTASVRRIAARLAGRHGVNLQYLVADEGGVSAAPGGNAASLELVQRAISDSGLTGSVIIALDVAATQFGRDGNYELPSDNTVLTPAGFAAEMRTWTERYPIVSIEDPFSEDDWASWSRFALELGAAQVIGDDLIATNAERTQRAHDEGAANSVLVKVNQAGTVARALDVVATARRCGMNTVVSARSGETEQTWLADLAVGIAAGQIKVGSTHRSERTSKWNRLLELEARYSKDIEFAGAAFLTALSDRREVV
jgi:enolase